MSARRGVTLVELIVVMTLLAITSSLATVALRRIGDSPRAEIGDQVLTFRRAAIHGRHPVTNVLRSDSAFYPLTILADGRVLADSSLGLDHSTGIRRAATP